MKRTKALRVNSWVSMCSLAILVTSLTVATVSAYAQTENVNVYAQTDNTKVLSSTLHQSNPSEPVLSLQAQANASVPNDQLTVTLSTEAEGSDLAQLNAQVIRLLDRAINEAKKNKDITVGNGNFYTLPSYDNKGKNNGFKVRAELILTSPQLNTLSTLLGQLSAYLSINQLQFALSDRTRQEQEQRLIASAISNFNEKAIIATKSLGYSHTIIQEINLYTNNENMPVRPQLKSFSAASMRASDTNNPLPIEPGSSTVTVNVSGKLQLIK